MGRAEFEYDEVGNTFYYVLVSFYAIILLPCTYIFFPTNKKEERVIDERQCQCNGCIDKRDRQEANKPWRRRKKIIQMIVLLVAWAIFILLVQKVSNIENTHEDYDPYAILGLDSGAEVSEIRKKYRDLTKKHHPDRGGDAVAFDRIAKAYQALTDDEARANWEKYGNPDGPTATTFGIALPKWLVSKEYGLWVLAFYGLLFMVILPVGVGFWWYNSIKYNVDKVLLDTTQVFYYFLHKTPKMETNRMLMILSGAFEFWKQYNKEIVERETDDVELPRLMKQISNLGENKKERPLSLPYALKARILLYCHLNRMPLDSEGLEFDQNYIITRCLRLVEEMISCSQQLTFYSQTKISMETIDNMLRLQPMIVQALWPKHSPLLQLPHINDHTLYHLKKNKIHTCADLARLDETKRRQILKSLDDVQYRNVLVVLSSMPSLNIETSFEVQGEDDKHDITAGCVVTLKVKLTRHGLLDKDVIEWNDELRCKNEEYSENEEKANEVEDEQVEETTENKLKRKVWQKPVKKAKKGGKKPTPAKKPKVPAAVAAVSAEGSTPATPAEATPEKKSKKPKKEDDESDMESVSGSESSSGLDNNENSDSEEEDWQKGEKPVFETKSRETHPVHAPYYGPEKFEWWWLTLSYNDKKMKRLSAPITPCKTLTDTQTVELRFTAPEHKGIYPFTLNVRSDSYMDADYSMDIKLDVKEAKVIEVLKYEDTEDEDEQVDASSEDEYTEAEESEDDE